MTHSFLMQWFRESDTEGLNSHTASNIGELNELYRKPDITKISSFAYAFAGTVT